EVRDELPEEHLFLAREVLRLRGRRRGDRRRFGLSAKQPAPPRTGRHGPTLPDVDLLAIGEDPIAADQLYPEVTERLVVELDLAAGAAAHERSPPLEHDIDAHAERVERQRDVL